MSPNKLFAKGLGGCILAPGRSPYRLENGTQTFDVAITVSLLLAEPALRKRPEGSPIACEEAMALGYRLVRSYADAVMHGIA